MNQINYTEFWSPNPAQLGNFLHDVFGWHIDDAHADYIHFSYQMEKKPTAGGIHKAENLPEKGTRTMVYVRVPDLAATIAKIKAHGGTIIYGPQDVGEQHIIINFLAPEGTPIGAWHTPD